MAKSVSAALRAAARRAARRKSAAAAAVPSKSASASHSRAKRAADEGSAIAGLPLVAPFPGDNGRSMQSPVGVRRGCTVLSRRTHGLCRDARAPHSAMILLPMCGLVARSVPIAAQNAKGRVLSPTFATREPRSGASQSHASPNERAYAVDVERKTNAKIWHLGE